MKKTLVAVAMAAFISTGAMAKPVQHHTSQPHNNHTVHMTNPGHRPVVKHAHHHARPVPVVVHHDHYYHDNMHLLGDALIAFAILASNAM